MEHLKPLRKGNDPIVHAAKDRDLTWCGWKYVSDEKLNGSRIPHAGSTPQPLTCKKCAGAMHQALHEIFMRLEPQQVEDLYEQAAKLAEGMKRRVPARNYGKRGS